MPRPSSIEKKLANQSDVPLLDRDESILAFNERVLDWAKRPEVPLLERLRYLCIVSSNLDEFFEVRADLHMAAFRSNEVKGPYTQETFHGLYAHARAVVNEQYRLYNDVLLPSYKSKVFESFLMEKELLHNENGLQNIFKEKFGLCWSL